MTLIEQAIARGEFIASHLRYPGYLISDAGYVISRDGTKALKGGLSGKYPAVALPTPKGFRPKYIHRIVAETFHGAPKPGQQVRHLDGNRFDSRASNITWGTRSENMRDKERHGTAPWGEAHGRSKVTTLIVLLIRKFHSVGVPASIVMKRYGISKMAHWRIVTRRSWRHV